MSWLDELLTGIPLASVQRTRLEALKEERDRFERDLKEAERKISDLTKQLSEANITIQNLKPRAPGRLRLEMERILQFLALKHDGQFSETEIARHTELSERRTALFLAELEEVDGVRYVDSREPYNEWYIRKEGLSYLERFGLML